MTKVLDLDALVPEQHVVKYKGKEHRVVSVGVRQYASFLKTRDEYLKAIADNANDPDGVPYSLILGQRTIEYLVPTLSLEVISDIPMNALTSLIRLVDAIMRNALDMRSAGEEDEEQDPPLPKTS